MLPFITLTLLGYVLAVYLVRKFLDRYEPRLFRQLREPAYLTVFFAFFLTGVLPPALAFGIVALLS